MLRYAERSRRFGTGPPIYKNALDDERAPRLDNSKESAGDINHCTTAHAASEDLRRHFRQDSQRDRLGHLFETIERHVASQTPPRLDALVARAHHRIDPQ